jgi:predicted RND superfamily exporter protein
MREAMALMDRELRGGGGIEFVIDTGRENGLLDPDMMNRIDQSTQFARSLDGGEIWVGKTISIVDVVKETHKALNENDHGAYEIPKSRELLAQELLLFENSGSDDLEPLTDSQFRLARISMRTPMADGFHTPPFVAELKRGFRKILGDDVGIQATGLGVLFGRTFLIVNPTMAKSYALALLIITPLMVLLLGSLKRGLLAMISNLVPIWMTLGLMGWLDIPLDNSSLLVGCIIIGLAVDDTIHFMHKFHLYYPTTSRRMMSASRFVRRCRRRDPLSSLRV